MTIIMSPPKPTVQESGCSPISVRDPDIYGVRNPRSGAGKGKNGASETPMLRRAPTTYRLLGDSTNQ